MRRLPGITLFVAWSALALPGAALGAPAPAVNPPCFPLTSPFALLTVNIGDAPSGTTLSPATITGSLKAKPDVQWELPPLPGVEITDASGLGLFDSGPQGGGAWDYAYQWAGGFPYDVAYDGVGAGLVRIRPQVTPAKGPVGRQFVMKWGDASPPAGLVLDVQMQAPGASTWSAYQSADTHTFACITPSAPGTYLMRSRLRSPALHAHSRWSPPAHFTVT